MKLQNSQQILQVPFCVLMFEFSDRRRQIFLRSFRIGEDLQNDMGVGEKFFSSKIILRE
jgi:hypothetical protein